MQYGLVESYNDIELTCVVAVKDIWQIQPSWLHPCKVCDHGRSVGKIKFTRNRKMWGSGASPPPPPPEIAFQKKLELLRKF